MCDTMCAQRPGGTLFAKNSDRPVGERQVLEAHPRRPAGDSLRTTYLDLPDPGAHGLVGSRPDWMWGLEHGVNEHGVAIGNEEVWTIVDMHAEPAGLIGMDLVRLALERADTASRAVDVLTSLLERHGQGGIANAAHQEAYSSSFLVADGREGWIVETAGRTWATRRTGPGAAISNRISLGTDWSAASGDVTPGADFDRWRDPAMWTGHADIRLSATRAAVDPSQADITPSTLVATLRDHGTGPWGAPQGPQHPVADLPPGPAFDPGSGQGVSVCMHLRDYQATSASLVVSLPEHPERPIRLWASLGSPCASVLLPALSLDHPPPVLADPAVAARLGALARQVEHPETGRARLEQVRATFAPLERALWDEADEIVGTAHDRSAGRHPSPEEARAFADRGGRRLLQALTDVGA